MTPDQQKPAAHSSEPDDFVGVSLTMPPSEAGPDVVVCFTWSGPDAQVSGDISRSPSGLSITRAEVQALQPSGITHQALRKVPLGEILAAGRMYVAAQQDSLGSPTKDVQPLPPGRVLMTDDLLRGVALAYIEETGPGKDRAVLQRLEDRFGRPKGTVRTWIARARETGWLGPARQGRMGAEPGPQLRAWLAQAMTAPETIEKEAARIAQALGATTSGVVRGAMRAYNEPAELEASHQFGLPPMEAAVAAQVLYGRSLTEELAERAGRAGTSEETALQEVGQELRQALDPGAS